MNREVRTPDWIANVIPGIWSEDGAAVICPVCNGRMRQTDGYEWSCDVDHCPADSFEFNERIHNYGVPMENK